MHTHMHTYMHTYVYTRTEEGRPHTSLSRVRLHQTRLLAQPLFDRRIVVIADAAAAAALGLGAFGGLRKRGTILASSRLANELVRYISHMHTQTHSDTHRHAL